MKKPNLKKTFGLFCGNELGFASLIYEVFSGFILWFIECKRIFSTISFRFYAVTIQTYINQNRIDIASKTQEGSYVLAYVNDSLYVDSSINFICEIEFDKSKLKDSFEYHLNFIINPIADTAIVDINTTGSKIGENAFINYGIRGEFKGGQGAFNKRILKYIKSSGYTLNDTLRFELYFDNMYPSNLLYIKSENHEITNLIEQFYVASNKDIFYPPIHFGERLYTSYKFVIWGDGEDQKSFDF